MVGDIEPQLREAKHALQAGNVIKPLVDMQLMLLERPEISEAETLIGNIAIRSSDLARAEKHFSRAIATSKDTKANLLLNKAMVVDLQGRLSDAHSLYQAILAEDPDFIPAKRKLAKLLFLQRDYSASLDLFFELDADSFRFDEKYMIGVNYLELDKFEPALSYLNQAIADQPGYDHALFAKARLLSRVGNHDAARRNLEALNKDNITAAEWDYLYGWSLYCLGRVDEAIAPLEASTSFEQTRFQGLRVLGAIAFEREEFASALEVFEELLRQSPTDAAALARKGDCLIKLNRKEEALSFVTSVLDDDPDNGTVWNDFCIHLKTLEERDLAIEYYRRSAEKFPGESVIQFNFGHLLNELYHAEEALPVLQRAVLLNPQYAKAWNAVSVSYCIMLDLDNAERCSKRSITLDDQIPSPWLNLGIIYRSSGRFGEAVEAMRECLRLNPNDARAHSNLSYSYLLIGEIEQGFKQYDGRWLVPEFPSPRRSFRQRIWQGESLGKQGLVVYMEQGMGDEIMFAWYLQLLSKDAHRLVVDCDERLVPLFQRSFPSIEFIGRQEPIRPEGKAPDIAYKAPIGHIPKFYWSQTHEHIFKTWDTAGRSVQRSQGYLVADPDRRAHWRSYLDGFSKGRLKVGICWRSGVHTRARDLQYLTPEEIASSFDERFAVINLQYGHLEEETDALAKAGEKQGFLFDTPPDIDLRDDLDDLTALCAELDIIVTPLISTAFMAGAVGTPVWVFRSADCGRIWHQLGTPYVPWFPSMRLFIRHPLNPWSDTIDELKDAFSEVAAEGFKIPVSDF